MFKIDLVTNLFNCEQCNQLLVEPVTLSCGYSVCKRHLDKLLENKPKQMNKFECKLCKEKHYIPEDGFAINKSIQNALDIKLNTLKLNQVYEECKKEVTDAKNKIQKIEKLDKDPENYICEYFEELKRQVDLRKKELKLKLENCSDEIIQSIESTKENCIKFSRETKRLSTKIEEAKEELTELMDRFETFEIDNEEFEETMQSLKVHNGVLTRKLGEYKDSIIGDKKYTFEFKEINIKGLFGSLKEIEKVVLHLICPLVLFFLIFLF